MPQNLRNNHQQDLSGMSYVRSPPQRVIDHAITKQLDPLLVGEHPVYGWLELTKAKQTFSRMSMPTKDSDTCYAYAVPKEPEPSIMRYPIQVLAALSVFHGVLFSL